MNNKTELKEKLFTVANIISNTIIVTSVKENISKEYIDKLMYDILKALGEVSRADRCYIWENYKNIENDIMYMKQMYEWVDGVEPVQGTDLIEYVPYDPITYDILAAKKTINTIVKDMDEYNKSILEPQGIKSVLIAPIHLKDGLFWGFIGFDNCQTEELWEDFEEEILSNISTKIGEFLYKFKDLL